MNERKTKIVCTIGPATSSRERLKELIEAGMNVARLNFSHGSFEDHRVVVESIRQLSIDLNKPVAILQDLQGPKIRVKKFENDQITLTPGDEFGLTVDEVLGNQERVGVSYPAFCSDVQEGDTILLDDGLLQLKAISVGETEVKTRVEVGGVLKNNKGLNLPNAILSIDPLTEKDKQDLGYGLELDVDYIALSFVQKASDVQELKDLIKQKGKQTPVVSKIEKPQAVEKLEEILKVTDAVMVARGDLGVEMLPETVPLTQKKIISLCNKYGIPVITATQMLDSMISNPRPTRAEASDVANAVLDGTDAVMLSGETSVGKYAIKSVQTMDKILRLVEKEDIKNFNREFFLEDRLQVFKRSITICYSAAVAAEKIEAKGILCLTMEGHVGTTLARFRPKVPIYAFSPVRQTVNRLQLVWGIQPFYEETLKGHHDDDMVELVMTRIKKEKEVEIGDYFVLTLGLPFSRPRPTNAMMIEKIRP